MEQTYSITRFYAEGHDRREIDTGLTLEEAQAHCNDPETSSSTCTDEEQTFHTTLFGDWFDGYNAE